MEINFTGKTVVVTGAASGIGRAMACGFAREGAAVIAADIQEDNLNQLSRELKEENLQIAIQRCDVGKEADVASLFGANAANKGVDVVVHCAGITCVKQFTETAPEEYRRVIETNLTGTYYCLQQAVENMRNFRIPGSIIVISSINAYRPLPSQAIYSSTKAAIESMVQSLAMELADSGIRVNCIAPGAVNTALTKPVIGAGKEPERPIEEGSKGKRVGTIPIGRVAEPEEMVGTAFYLASSLSHYVTGASLTVDGGLILRR